jgi:hypothetical protein
MTLRTAGNASELADDIRLSERLSRMQGQEIGPRDVVSVLQAAGAKHVLVGAHAISAWAGDPRATMDVDVVASRPAQARDALSAAFPDLTVEEHPVVIRFLRERRQVIDVIRPTSSPIFNAALSNVVRVTLGDIEVDVPRLEMALALKFAAMASPTRQVKDKYQDAHDFIAMVQHNANIDSAKLTEFAELIYPGGGADVAKLVADARAGRRLEF